MRRFLDRLAIYFGLEGDGSPDPPPERPTLLTGAIAFFAGSLAGALLETVRALIANSEVNLSDLVWRGAVFGMVTVIVRWIEYRLRTRSTNSP